MDSLYAILAPPDTLPLAQSGSDPFSAALAGVFYIAAGLAVLSLPLEMLRQMWLEWKERRASRTVRDESRDLGRDLHRADHQSMPHEPGAAPADPDYQRLAWSNIQYPPFPGEIPPKPPGWGSLGEPIDGQ